MTKVLIWTAWAPCKSGVFKEYSESIVALMNEGIEAELYITSTLSDEKFESIIKSMVEAQYYAMYNGFTHLFNNEADHASPPGTLKFAVEADKDVLLFPSRAVGKGPAALVLAEEALKEEEGVFGWGTMLVKMDVLRRVPFEEGYRGHFCWPDAMWFKKVAMAGIDMWASREHTTKLLEEASTTPGAGFGLGLRGYVDKQMEGLKCQSP